MGIKRSGKKYWSRKEALKQYIKHAYEKELKGDKLIFSVGFNMGWKEAIKAIRKNENRNKK